VPPALLAERPTSLVLDPIEDTTRRRFITGAGAAALAAAFLAACGSEDDDPDAVEVRVLDDVLGSVELPTTFDRVVAADEITFGNMLALGVQPLGGAWYSAELAEHLRARVQEEPVNLVASGDFDIEQALALRPDLIVTAGASWVEDFCRQLKEGAPTYCYPYGYVTKDEIFGNLRGTAIALGLEAEAEALIVQYDERIAELRQKVVETGWDTRPVSIVEANSPESWYLLVNGVAPFVLSDLGIPRRAGEEFTANDVELSPERIGDLDSAYAIIAHTSPSRPEARDALEGNPLWPRLTPVQEWRVLWTNGPAWAGYDMLALFAVLDDIENKLLPLAG